MLLERSADTTLFVVCQHMALMFSGRSLNSQVTSIKFLDQVAGFTNGGSEKERCGAFFGATNIWVNYNELTTSEPWKS